MNTEVDEETDRLVRALGRAIRESGGTVATAESLTGGLLASALSAAPEASEWYRGGIVAYQPQVKYRLLHAPIGPVVTASTAAAMSRSIASLLDADFAVAVTGVGGPDPQDGRPAGTVVLASWVRGRDILVEHHHFFGTPLQIVHQTIRHAVRALLSNPAQTAVIRLRTAGH